MSSLKKNKNTGKAKRGLGAEPEEEENHLSDDDQMV